ncbi:MAG: hypothetical protein RIK87_04150 [Fuerstiella sp.]
MFQTKVFSAPCHVVARATVFCAVMVVGLISRAPVLSAGIIQVGDLNIIDDPGNPSNGLRYLDMSFSDGLTLADALANAQATYPNARLATPSEADDLFNASGLSLDNTDGFLNLSGGWETGPNLIISSGSNYDTSLRDILGHTGGSTFNPVTAFWTDPDGESDWDTTGDAISFNNHFVYRVQGPGPPRLRLRLAPRLKSDGCPGTCQSCPFRIRFGGMDRIASAKAAWRVFRYLIENDIQLGYRSQRGANRGQLEWRQPNAQHITSVPHQGE